MQSEMPEVVQHSTLITIHLSPDSDIFVTFQDKHFYIAIYVLNEMGSLLIY